jgi:hypothetical protein
VLFPEGLGLTPKRLSKTREEIMHQASILLQFASLVLADEWPAIKKDVCAI